MKNQPFILPETYVNGRSLQRSLRTLLKLKIGSFIFASESLNSLCFLNLDILKLPTVIGFKGSNLFFPFRYSSWRGLKDFVSIKVFIKDNLNYKKLISN